jgi:anti-sigma28 factor (negative regulator of flagellin synthesis)
MDSSRMERIAELSRQIKAGEYKVDSRELAEAILATIKGD